ncbi:probable methyltransferase tdiE [Trichoderma asperellum]|uniref:Probable methyltransferase tdiE n=1 Tax=Trichoderma asperellum TaxID=101201 RepID=A0A6V8QQZ3_TRIAP|nr:probable methyltransferase tdiE [Trichoderma asperellum]
MIIEDDSSGSIPNTFGRPPSPASTGSAITVGTSQNALLIKSLEQGEYVPDDESWDETRSLTDSIRQHIVDGGLRYHAYHAGQYAFPNDETEQYRDDLKHNLTIHLCEGAYFFAPIHDRLLQPGAEVLDLGVFLQDMHLKPGGYVEVQEFQYAAACDDESCNQPYAWRDFLRFLADGLAALGANLHAILNVQDELAAAGFQGIRRVDLKCPNGPWPKLRRLQECGHILRDVIMWGLVGLARRPFMLGLGWTTIQIEMFLVDVRKSIIAEENGLPKFHSYFPFHSIYGYKPLDAA